MRRARRGRRRSGGSAARRGPRWGARRGLGPRRGSRRRQLRLSASKPLHPGHELGEGQEATQLDELQERQLEGHTGIRALPQLAFGPAQQVDPPQEVFLGEGLGPLLEAFPLLGQDRVQERAALGSQLHEQDFAHVQHQLADEVAVVGTVVGEALHQLEHGEAVAGLDGP